MITDKDIAFLRQHSELRDIDFHFAEFISRLAQRNSRELFIAAALASSATGEKNICLDLAQMENRPLTDAGLNNKNIYCPDLKSWRKKLEMCSVFGKPGDYKPLILDSKDRLYLYRYFDYEQKLSDSIKKRLITDMDPEKISRVKTYVKNIFILDPAKPDYQVIAAVTTALQNISVISGGPGTGKTSTIIKALELILSVSNQKLKIYLAAPTGKAANRLMESVVQGTGQSGCSDEMKACFPQEAYTIHRLLGTKWGTPYFKHNEDNLLHADVVVIDEASMVDLALMSKLFSAIPENSKIILAGDKDQLSSVESGSVLGDICDRQHTHNFSKSYRTVIREITGYKLAASEEYVQSASRLSDNIVVLDKSYRFTADSGIGEFGKHVNRGDVNSALDLLNDPAYPDIEFKELASPQHLAQLVSEKTLQYFNTQVVADRGLKRFFTLFDRFKILCTLKNGPFGIHAINDLVEDNLVKKNIISFSNEYASGHWYIGKPVMIKSNNYALGLFNGDIGIIMADDTTTDRNILTAWFQSGPSQNPRRFPLYQLPDHDIAYAMTIHKSQGSEFDDIVIILPEKDTPFLTRELIYTAITRARKTVTIWGSEKALSGAISRTIQRASGLRDSLWDEG
ncbi:MAG: exodeoxyribonuclease V subunit alpha [Desulfobacterales bacterium]|nr:exodeoxyribonuclease V subunit alpha [Desulfobacterales bacterium]